MKLKPMLEKRLRHSTKITLPQSNKKNSKLNTPKSRKKTIIRIKEKMNEVENKHNRQDQETNSLIL